MSKDKKIIIGLSAAAVVVVAIIVVGIVLAVRHKTLTTVQQRISEGCVKYAKNNGGSTGTCDTWATACKLQRAIDQANSEKLGGSAVYCEVWAKEGTYLIYQSSRADRINLKSYVHLYGGFEGTEAETVAAREARSGDPTILHGNQYGTNSCATASDCVYNLMWVSGEYARVDRVSFRYSHNDQTGGGFTKSGGVFGGFFKTTFNECEFTYNTGHSGGAMWGGRKSAIIQNSKFVNNHAYDKGGAIYWSIVGPDMSCYVNGGNDWDDCPIIQDCTFEDNTVASGATGGGAIYLDRAPTLIQRSIFEDNKVTGTTSSGDTGSAIFVYSPPPNPIQPYAVDVKIADCLFDGNTSKLVSGAAYGTGTVFVGYAGTLTTFLYNNTFAGNVAGNGCMVGVEASTIELRGSVGWNTACEDTDELTTSGGASLTETRNAYRNATCTNCIDLDASTNPPNFVATGDYHLKTNSPLIDEGHDTYASSADVEQKPRFDYTSGGQVADIGCYERQTRANGLPCTAGSQCVNGYCVDGYCCSTACEGDCRGCGVAGSLGTCTYYAQGTDPDNDCGACVVCTGGTSCGDKAAYHYNDPDCVPYLCGSPGSGCLTFCVTSADCAPGYSCNEERCI